MIGAAILTASGHPVNLINLTVADIDFSVIASSLAKLCRWAGHTTKFYSVAQHSLLVANQLPPDIQAYGLLHDAHEAYIGDITTPVAFMLEKMGAGEALATLKHKIDSVIYAAAGLEFPVPYGVKVLVQRADLRVLATEARDVMPSLANNAPDIFAGLPAPCTKPISPVSWAIAAAQFEEKIKECRISNRRISAINNITKEMKGRIA